MYQECSTTTVETLNRRGCPLKTAKPSGNSGGVKALPTLISNDTPLKANNHTKRK